MGLRIDTERLVLRPFSVADVDDVTEYQSIEECVRYVPFGVRSHDDVRAAFARQQPTDRLDAPGDFFILGMELRSSGRVIGQVNMGFEAATPKTASFGYLTHRDYWRSGYTREAISALLDYAARHEAIEVFTAVIVDQNLASIRLAESLGMHLTGSRLDPDSPCIPDSVGSPAPDTLNDYAMRAADWLAR